MTEQSHRLRRCNPAASVSQAFRALFTPILPFPKDIKHLTFHSENCHQTQMFLNTGATALGDLANRYGTPSLVRRRFPSLQARKRLCPAVWNGRPSLLTRLQLLWKNLLGLDQSCAVGDNPRLSPAAGPEAALPGPSLLPAPGPCAHAGALERERRSSIKLFQAANGGIPLLSSSQLLQAFPLLP